MTPIPRDRWRPQSILKPTRHGPSPLVPAPPQRIPTPPQPPTPPPPALVPRQLPQPRPLPPAPGHTPPTVARPAPTGDRAGGRPLGILAGVAASLQSSPQLPDAPDFHTRSPLPLSPSRPHAPLTPPPDMAAREGPAARAPTAFDRPGLPPLLPPQLGRASEVPPPMQIEAY